MTGTLGPIYTLAEAAAKLRTTRHAVSKAARQHGLCAIMGRDLRFTDADLVALFEAMRPEPKYIRQIDHGPPLPSPAETARKVEAFRNRVKKRLR